MAAPATINYQSPLPDLVKILDLALGQKTKTSGKTTEVGSADISGLQSILAQQTDPAALENLVASLFAQGAEKVPALTTQYANATGSRVTNNSMLGSSLAQLNQSLAQSIADAIIKQQSAAAATAGKIADSTRSTTKNINQTVARQGREKELALAGLVGKGLNLYEKTKTGTAKKIPDAVGSSNLPSSSVLGTNLSGTFPELSSAAPIFGVSGGGELFDLGAASAIPFNLSNFVDFGIPDAVSNIVNFGGNSFTDAADNIYDAGSSIADGGNGFLDSIVDFGSGLVDSIKDIGGGLVGKISDFVSDWFADGGTVNADSALKLNQLMEQKRNGIIQSGGTPKYFADGGQVKEYADGGETAIVRNIPNFGTTPTRYATPVAFSSAFATPSSTKSRVDAGGAGTGIDVNTLLDALLVGDEGTSPGPSGAIGTSSNIGTAAGIANAVMAANPIGMAMLALQAVLANELANVDPVEVATIDPTTGLPPAEQSPAPVESIDPTTGEAPSGVADAGPNATSAPPSGESPDSTSGENSTDAAAAAAGVGDGSGDAGGSASGDAFSDGGSIKKQGNNKDFRLPIDDIPIKAMEGEYVLPVSVVDYIGKDVLDDLVAILHTPIKSGTHG